MLQLNCPGTELRRLLNLRIKLLEQHVVDLRADAEHAAAERKAELERNAIFQQVFPAQFVPHATAGVAVGSFGMQPTPMIPPIPPPGMWINYAERQISDAEHHVEMARWLLGRIREDVVYDLTREDLGFLGFVSSRLPFGNMPGL